MLGLARRRRRRVIAAYARGRCDGVDRVVRVSRELRPADCLWHGLHRRRRVRSRMAWGTIVRQPHWPIVDCRRLRRVGLDNNLTRRVALADPVETAALKGVLAAPVTLAIAFLTGASIPSIPTALSGTLVGFFGYRLSLVLFVLALRHLGAARTRAYFSTAPFVGAVAAIPLLGEPFSAQLLLAGVLMGVGIWLHLSERHQHAHYHTRTEHAHSHRHDQHHCTPMATIPSRIVTSMSTKLWSILIYPYAGQPSPASARLDISTVSRLLPSGEHGLQLVPNALLGFSVWVG